MKKYVVGFIFEPKMEHVLLLERVKAPFQGLWNGIGGKIELDESPEQAMLREYVEETGMKTDDCHPFEKLVTLTLGEIELHAFYSVVRETPSFAKVVSTREGNLEWLHLEGNALLYASNSMLAGEGNIPYFLHLASLKEKERRISYETGRFV